MSSRVVMSILFVSGLICLAFGLLDLIDKSRIVAGPSLMPTIMRSDLGNKVGWLFTTGALPLLGIPILAHRGNIPTDYYSSSPKDQNRINLVWCILCLPAMLVLVSFAGPSECRAGLQCGKLALLTIVYLAFFGYLLLKRNRSKSK